MSQRLVNFIFSIIAYSTQTILLNIKKTTIPQLMHLMPEKTVVCRSNNKFRELNCHLSGSTQTDATATTGKGLSGNVEEEEEERRT
jgi:hypothetical protein